MEHDEEKMLENLRKKWGMPQKTDHQKELERLFGKRSEQPEDKLRKNLKPKELTIGEEITVTIEKITSEGDGLGRSQRTPVFVPDALPGDTVRVRLTRVKSNAYFGELIEVIAPSANRTRPICPVFKDCGGCRLQNLVYAAQLKAKQEMCTDVLSKIGQIDIKPRHPVHSLQNFNYRLRAKLQIQGNTSKTRTGYFSRASHKFVPVSTCAILLPVLNKTINLLPTILPAPGTAPLPDVVHLQTNPDQTKLHLHFNSEKPLLYLDRIFSGLVQNSIPVSGVSSDFPDSVANIGEQTISHSIGQYKLENAGTSFFQTNAFLLKKMQSQAIMLCSPTSKDIVLDLYCGCGFFSIPIASYVAQLIGLDIDAAAIENARKNAMENNLGNTTFITSKDSEFTSQAQMHSIDPSLVIMDPPRSGLPNQLVEWIIRKQPAKLLYVSCNPATFARDAAKLIKSDFRLRVIQPIDLFPQTHHLELIAFFTHKFSGAQAATSGFLDLH